MKHSLRRQLNRVVLATTCVALVLAGLALMAFDLRSYQQGWEQELRTQADLVGLATAPALAFNDPRAAAENLALLKARPDIQAAAIYRTGGTLFARYTRPGAAGAPAAAPPEGISVDGGAMALTQRIADEGEPLGLVHLQARHEWLGRLLHYGGVLAVVLAATLVLALLLSDRLVALVTRPILAVSEVARRITASHDYSLRAARTTDDEVGQVVDAFNEMLDELALRARTLEQAHAETLRLNAELEERVRRRTAQLEAANGELEAFSYSASHDLRSPLRVIDSFSNLLQRSLGEQLEGRDRHYLERIRFNVRHMSDLIDALLSLAQVSRASLRRETVDLGAMARAALDECREREPERAVQAEVAPGLAAEADPALVQQVLRNLVGNAWKFTSKVGAARISVGIETQADGSAAWFVRDNGAGFDMAYANNLFGAFQRLHTASEFPGTGIGLATVHRIIVRHEGRIWAHSSPGEGAVFYFTLGPPPR